MRANCLFKLMEARLCVKHFAMFSTVSFFSVSVSAWQRLGKRWRKS